MVHSHRSKMKKKLAGLQPANYSYGRHIPMNDAFNSHWNFPKIPNDICIPCGDAGNGIIDECNCCIVDNVVDNIANVSFDDSLDTALEIDDKETAIFNALPQDDSSVEDILSIDNE